MKLVIRFRDVVPTPALLDHVKHSVARTIEPSEVRSLRVSLSGETHGAEEWYRCRIEVGLRSGALRLFEAGSSELLFAVDAAADRLELLRDRYPHAA